MVPVIFAINDAYSRQLRVALLSLYRHAHQSTRYHIYVVHYNVSQKSMDTLLAQQQVEHPLGIIQFLQLTQEQWRSLQMDNRWGVESRFRYYAPLLLSHLSQAIYLDTDILVQDDLTVLYNVDVKNYLFASVMEERSSYRNYCIAEHFAQVEGQALQFLPHTALYPNSGVLVMNLALMRAVNFTQRAITLSQKIPKYWLLTSRHDFFVMPDQDVLYYLAHTYSDGILFLPERYNHIVGYYYYKDLPQFVSSEEYDQHTAYINAVSDLASSLFDHKPAIIHYADTAPWNKKRGLVPYEKLYRSYAKEIGWKLPNKWFINTMTWFKRRYFYSKTTRDAWGRKGMALLVVNITILTGTIFLIIIHLF